MADLVLLTNLERVNWAMGYWTTRY